MFARTDRTAVAARLRSARGGRNPSQRTRKLLLGSTALVGVSLASPALAQTITPAGGGTVTTTNGTITGGGPNEGVLVDQAGAGGVTVSGVTIMNTGTSPTADAAIRSLACRTAAPSRRR